MHYRDDDSIGYGIERGPQMSRDTVEASIVEDYCNELIAAMTSQDEAKDTIIADLEKGNLTIDQARLIARALQLD